jgi:hypothetical protein
MNESYSGSTLMQLMGDDFQYEYAQRNFENI